MRSAKATGQDHTEVEGSKEKMFPGQLKLVLKVSLALSI